MAYQGPSVTASGINFATWQASGATGHLEKLIAAQAATAAPTVAATLTETAGSATLPSATYYAAVTETNGIGETTMGGLVSSGLSITLGQNLVCTYQALKSGNVARNLYLGTSPTGPFTLAASGVTASSTTISAPLPTNSYAMSPPSTNSTGLTYTDASGVVDDKTMSLIRACEKENLEDVYKFLSGVFTNFNSGSPMTFSAVISKLRHAHTVIALLNQLCNEAGTLIDANPGHITSALTPIGSSIKVRVWP